MIKNCIIMLMVFTMTASAWCCGVRAISSAQAQNQVKQQQPQPNIPISQPAPAPVPQPETLAELIKDVAADYDKFGSNDQEVAFDDNANERLSEQTLTRIDEFAAAFDLPVSSKDTDESRILRNEKQIAIAEKLVPQVLAEVTSFINDINADVSKFVTENSTALEDAPGSLIDAYYDQVSVLHGEFFRDLEGAAKKELGTANINTNNLEENVLPDNSVQLETNNENAVVTSTNIPTGQNIIDRLNFTKEQFLNDFKLVRESTISEIEGLTDAQNDQSTSINTTPDFDGALDTSFKSPTQAGVNSISFDILSPLSLPGANFDRGTSSIVSIITQLKDRFPNTQLASDLQFFLDIFPSSAEVAVQDSLEPKTDLFADGNTTLNNIDGLEFNKNNKNQLADFDTENTFTATQFDIGLDGRLVGVDNRDNQADPTSVTTIVSDVSSISGDSRGFNSRSFGGSPGQHKSVSIFINDKQYDIVDTVFTSPIVIDIDGDGKLEASSGVHLPHVYKDGRIVEFDINGDGFVDLTEWVGKNDGLLIQYDPSKPVNGAQLFGDCDGFINGYEKLKSLDADENGLLNGSEIATLSVWQDKNLNAKVDAGEIKSLTELKITELSVEHDNFVSSCVMDGKDVTMWDWYPSMFRVKKRK
ncbi:hypothetical protein [Candidatus Uabimicrobium sp. HlEnr_7]|uniref:hypothetical protein n=1 Tax=Candidatus Uabimicrobium helgolandensis TaxID=3095367 RepID=UPI003557B3B5